MYQTPEQFIAQLEHEARHHENERLVPVGERRCPICQQTMRPETYFGETIEACADHGIWLDKGELETIVGLARNASPAIRQQALEEARRRGKLQGAMFGVWSLLLN